MPFHDTGTVKHSPVEKERNCTMCHSHTFCKILQNLPPPNKKLKKEAPTVKAGEQDSTPANAPPVENQQSDSTEAQQVSLMKLFVCTFFF